MRTKAILIRVLIVALVLAAVGVAAGFLTGRLSLGNDEIFSPPEGEFVIVSKEITCEPATETVARECSGLLIAKSDEIGETEIVVDPDTDVAYENQDATVYADSLQANMPVHVSFRDDGAADEIIILGQ